MFHIFHWKGEICLMDMGNIYLSYWDLFLFTGKRYTFHGETFLFPLPTGKLFVLQLGNVSHFYWERVSLPTLKLSLIPVGNVCPSDLKICLLTIAI